MKKHAKEWFSVEILEYLIQVSLRESYDVVKLYVLFTHMNFIKCRKFEIFK